MVRSKTFICAFGVILLSATISWAGPKINPGQWEITTKTDMAGLPSQSFTQKQCITEDDMVPMASQDPNQDCQIKDMKTSGNTVSWEMVCSGQGGEMNGKGEVTYSGDTMKGKMDMTMKAMNMKIKSTFSGKRIGPCDANSSSSSVTFDSSPQLSAAQAMAEEAYEEEETIDQNTEDIEAADKDEKKESKIDGVKKGVKGFFKKVFKE